jgi:hypothetical protein
LISGPDAFLLWDTFGFPVDLTQLMAEEHGLAVDAAGFEAAMEEARQKSRQGGRKAGVSGTMLCWVVWACVSPGGGGGFKAAGGVVVVRRPPGSRATAWLVAGADGVVGRS